MQIAESDIEARGRKVASEYRSVFGERAHLAIRAFGANIALVISDWLWLYQEHPGSYRWSVRIVLPDDEWFYRFDCLTRRDGYEVEKPSFEEAVVYLFQHETHRRCHAAREGNRWRR